jgi:predicted lipase
MPQTQPEASSPQSVVTDPHDLPTLLAAFAYDRSVEAVPSLSVPHHLASPGFTEFWSFHNGLTDGWAYIARSRDLIILSFRGTKSVQNWATNFHVALIHPDGTAEDLRVHDGFYRAFKTLSDGKDGLDEKIAEIKDNTGGKIPIYITGHSLGGALAQIASAVFGDDQVAACYTFGSPRVGNSYFDLWVKVPSYRLLNHADIAFR